MRRTDTLPPTYDAHTGELVGPAPPASVAVGDEEEMLLATVLVDQGLWPPHRAASGVSFAAVRGGGRVSFARAVEALRDDPTTLGARALSRAIAQDVSEVTSKVESADDFHILSRRFRETLVEWAELCWRADREDMVLYVEWSNPFC